MSKRWPAALAGAILLVLLHACAKEDRTLELWVSTEEPAPTIADAVRETLATRGLSVTVETATNPADALAAVVDGQLDLAIIEEPEQPIHGLVTLAPLYPSVLHVMHNREGSPNNLAEVVRGAKLYAGPPNGAAQRLLMQLSTDFGVSEDQFQLLDNPWTVQPDVYFIFGGLLSHDSIAQLDGYRLFSFATDGDMDGGTVADGIALRHHHLRPFVLPRGTYGALGHDAILTLSTRTVLVANENLDPEVAFVTSAALFANAQEISVGYPLVTRELDEGLNPTNLMLPLHSGTRRYLDRDNPGFVERNVDVLALALTIFLAVGSGAIALYRHRQQVRKDRVDVYYGQLLDIRSAMAHDGIEKHAEHKQQVLDVQREVLQLLIDERIAADTSLVAFVSLSNQLIEELSRSMDRA